MRILPRLLVCAALMMTATGHAQQSGPAPVFTASGALVLPADYREWVFVGTGLGMQYGPNKRKDDNARFFDNIYVPRDTYRAFMSSGKWPEKTVLVMEVRSLERHDLLANLGETQGGPVAVEVHVKDSTRFPDTTWGFFNFGAPKSSGQTATLIPKTASCYTCHAENTAVENTFVQYYPELFEAAKKFGTVKPAYDPKKRF